ncbi:6-bladed beta-propeller [Aquiflexum sp. LQ15W]|uniref:6-bladed beta-propeller n=1 Tax=Cognataquiflexum nitidum TaxID=2922272 RepID=UPI001F12AEF7|nr:6-bladed beta-propeller [Cognataquiflexum nitidum]MCH6201495.1 6-bladed beta-propeller [Cognataquiflexum nitidum]
MRNLIIITFCTILISCGHENQNTPERIDLNLKESKTSFLSENFEGIEYILLDYQDFLPMVQPYNFIFYKNYIFVNDRILENIFVFSSNGKVLKVIKSTGTGPQEFIQINDFQIFKDQILIKDNRLMKIIAFDFDGNFKFEMKEDLPSYNFYLSEEFTTHFMNNDLSGEGFNFLVKTKGNVIDKQVKIKEGMVGNKMAVSTGFKKNNFKNEVVFTIPFSYEIALFDTLGKYKKTIEFDLKDTGIDLDKRVELMNGALDYTIVKEEGLTEMITSFYPFDRQYFAFFERGGNEFNYVFLDENFKVTSQSNSLKNDIDGMTIRNVPWTSTNEHLVFQINSNEFLDDYNKKFDKAEKKFPNASIHEFISKNSHLLDQDKTVLVLLKVKNPK